MKLRLAKKVFRGPSNRFFSYRRTTRRAAARRITKTGTLKVFCDDYESFVAFSEQHAYEVRRLWGWEVGDDQKARLYEMPGDAELKIYVDESCKKLVRRSCAEWARVNGPGFLCSTEC